MTTCIKCNAELRDDTSHCWKCAAPTPSHKVIAISGLTKSRRDKELVRLRRKYGARGWRFIDYEDKFLTGKAFFHLSEEVSNRHSVRLLIFWGSGIAAIVLLFWYVGHLASKSRPIEPPLASKSMSVEQNTATERRAKITKNSFGCDDETFTWGFAAEEDYMRAEGRLLAAKAVGKCIDLLPGDMVNVGRASTKHAGLIEIQPLGSNKKFWTAVGLLDMDVRSPATVNRGRDALPSPNNMPKSSGQHIETDELRIQNDTARRIPEPNVNNPGGKASQRSTAVDFELARSRSEALKKTKETRAHVEKLLALHEAELKRITEVYERRRELYFQGEISRNDLVQAEQAVAQTVLRIQEDKRFLAEVDTAIAKETSRDSSLSQ